ncbi:hypothetical protein LTR51_008608 [Lithohypha guttulata]|nr:hypothetical protein LTR51_008608 [Lithohypha guttulata]
MDFGGHNSFDDGMNDDIDDTGLFVDTADHDFSLPPTQSTINPLSIQGTGHSTGPPGGTTRPSGFSKGALRRRELTSRPDAASVPQRQGTSPIQRRSMGSGISKPRPARQTATATGPVAGSLRRSLQETLTTSTQTFQSQMASMNARMQAIEDRMSQIEADSHRTQDDLRLCMSEVNGALEVAESFNHQIYGHATFNLPQASKAMAFPTPNTLIDHVNQVNHVLAGTPVLSDQPPSLQPFDLQMRQMNAPTFALGFQPGAVTRQKGLPRPTYEQRLVEIVREKAALMREVRFFRTVYQATEDMQDRIRSVVQDLILNYYVRPKEVGEADGAWLELADELDFVLFDFAHVVELAAQDWMELEQQQQVRDRWSQI